MLGSSHRTGSDPAELRLAIVELWKWIQSDSGQDLLPAVDPIVLQQAAHRIRLAYPLYPLGLRIEFVNDGGNISHLRRHLNHRVRPAERRVKFLTSRGGPQYDGTPGRAFEQAGWYHLLACDLVCLWRLQCRRVKPNEITRALDHVGQQQPMLRPVFDPRIGTGKRVIDVEEAAVLSQCHELSVERDRAVADRIDVDHPFWRRRIRRGDQAIHGRRKKGAGSTGVTRKMGNAGTMKQEHVIELVQQSQVWAVHAERA